MAKLVKLPNLRYGSDGGYVNPAMVTRIENSFYRDPFDKTGKKPEQITVLYVMPNFRFEFAGHIQDDLAQIVWGE